jgi:hypothetical protein
MDAYKNGWVNGLHEKHPSHEDIAAFSMTTAEVEAYVRETWETVVKQTSHPSCEEHFMRYGAASWPHCVRDGVCPVCGLPRLCGGVDRKHEWRTVTPEECRRRGIYHASRCYRVHECVHCGKINSIDSSD